MLQGLRTTVYHVSDLEQAKAWYSDLLGYGPYFDEPFYVGFDVGGYELGLLPAEPDELPGAVTYWGVADIEAAIATLIEKGANAADPVTDVVEGIKLATVRSPLGNLLGVIENPHFAAR